MAHSKRLCIDCDDEHNYYCNRCGYPTEACKECHDEIAHGVIHSERLMKMRPNEKSPVENKGRKRTPEK